MIASILIGIGRAVVLSLLATPIIIFMSPFVAIFGANLFLISYCGIAVVSVLFEIVENIEFYE